MKNLIWFFFFLFTYAFAFSQNTDCNCLDDLEYLNDQLKQTPSYKEQIKGERKKAFYKYVEQIKQEIKKEKLIELHCQVYLQKILSQIKDAHLLTVPTVNAVKTEEQIRAFRESAAFKLTPTIETELEPLEQWVSSLPPESITGIYYTQNKLLKIGLIKEAKQFKGVVLDSKT